MKPAVAHFTAISRLTFLSVVRQTHFLLISIFAIAAIVCTPFFTTYTLGESLQMLQDSTLALFLFCGLLLAAISAGSALSREIRTGTASAILSKPVSRTTFFLAKYTGVSIALFLYAVTATAASLLAVRTGATDSQFDWTGGLPAIAALVAALLAGAIWNYRTRRPFSTATFFFLLFFFLLALSVSAFSPAPLDSLRFPANLSLEMLPVCLLLFCSLLMLAAFASAIAIRFDLTAVWVSTTLLFFCGLVSDYFLGPHMDTSFWAASLYALLPNPQAFWLLDALHTGSAIPGNYILLAMAYALAWLLSFLLLGAWLLHHMEITEQTT